MSVLIAAKLGDICVIAADKQLIERVNYKTPLITNAERKVRTAQTGAFALHGPQESVVKLRQELQTIHLDSPDAITNALVKFNRSLTRKSLLERIFKRSRVL